MNTRYNKYYTSGHDCSITWPIKIDPAAAVHASYGSAGQAKMKTILFDSLDEAAARKLTGCKVIDESGEPVGTVDGLWMDSSSHGWSLLVSRIALSPAKCASSTQGTHRLSKRDVC